MAEETNFTPIERARQIVDICRAQNIDVAAIQTDGALCGRLGINPEEVSALRNELEALKKVNADLLEKNTALTADKAAADKAAAEKTAAEKDTTLKAEFEKATKGKDERTVKAATAQLELKRAGLLDGNIDGVFGEATRNALGKVTAENTNPALTSALGALDAKDGYNKNNQDAINGAKDKINQKQTGTSTAADSGVPAAAPAVPVPSPRPAQVNAVAEREAKIKAAQTELAKAGFYGDAAKATPDSVVDGKIGAKTNEAMAKARDAVVKATAQGNECPEHLKEAAKATETLKEIQGNDAKEQAQAQAKAAKNAAEREEVKRRPAARQEPSTTHETPARSAAKENTQRVTHGNEDDKQKSPAKSGNKPAPDNHNRNKGKPVGGGNDNFARYRGESNFLEQEAIARINGMRHRNGEDPLSEKELRKLIPKQVEQIRIELNAVTTGEKRAGDVLKTTGRQQLFFGTIPDVHENDDTFVGVEGRKDLRDRIRKHSATKDLKEGLYQVRSPTANDPAYKSIEDNFGADQPVHNVHFLRAANGKKVAILDGGATYSGDKNGSDPSPGPAGNAGNAPGGGGKGGGVGAGG